MTKEEQKEFVEDYCENIKNDMLAVMNTVPAHWEGIELRWFIENKFKSHFSGKEYKSRKKAYENSCAVEGL